MGLSSKAVIGPVSLTSTATELHAVTVDGAVPVTVTYSATPTFNFNLGNLFKITLTGDAAPSFTNVGSNPRRTMFLIAQDSTGGRVFTWPSGWTNMPPVTRTASAVTAIEALFDGSNAYPVAPGSHLKLQVDDTTINAGFFAGATNAARVQAAVTYAAANSFTAVRVPASLLPYDASAVTFNTGVHMLREGGSTSRAEHEIEAYGASGDGTTDVTANVQAAINGAVAAGAHAVVCDVPSVKYLVSGQLTIPTSGSSPNVIQPSLCIRGRGASYASGYNTAPVAPPSGEVVLDLQYNGTYGKILTVGYGRLEITNLTLIDSAGDSLPMIYTTGTTLFIHGCGFAGSKTGTSCDQDAIVLGGTDVSLIGSADPTAMFSGYGTIIRDNWFNGIRSAVVGNDNVNGVLITGNNIWRPCGSNTATTAAIHINGNQVSRQSSANMITDNLIEMDGYGYGVRCTGGADNVITGNTFFDQDGSYIADIWIDGTQNLVLFAIAGSNPVRDDSGTGKNNIIGGLYGGSLMLGGVLGNEVLRLYAGVTADLAYMSFYPRSANRATRGGYFGFPAAAATDMTVKAELGNLVLDSTSGTIKPNVALTPNKRVVDKFVALTYSTTVTPDAGAGNVYRIIVTDGVAFTIANPSTAGSAGQLLAIQIYNNAGIALGAVTWGNQFKLVGGAWTQPGSGSNRQILFMYTDHWYEIARSSGDVPN